ncbi:TPA: hypothetical protein QDZ34_001790 [Stenotrophomonas maltophilia]|nr:hypothetical protein [Stenotrophomonas maltophilia]HDS1026329.1 hypothetical protein [Stenotrophomonas maltophilia]HDS1031059.1 hypothetical protein [Stenotrophomonas maltophilia]HDS1034447.1 hypothetical protein [Stenotrophomonas maltophilia]
MNLLRLMPALLLCLPLIACGDNASSSSDTSPGKAVAEATGNVGKTVKDATDKARQEIAKGNIKISADNQPQAEITPDGRLLIGGKEVETTAAQRSQLLDYRGHVAGIAQDGMDIGVAGAKLGASAAGEALKGVFSGDTDGIEKRINAEAAKIEAQAKQLCNRLPAMLASQQALARDLPAFKPYATMDQSDVDDCGKDTVVNR